MKRSPAVISFGAAFGIAFSVALLVTAAVAPGTDPFDGAPALVEVRSAVEGTEVVVDGRYFSLSGAGLNVVLPPQRTPFTIDVASTDFVGLFRAVEGQGGIVVTLTVPVGAGSAVAEASGDVGVVVRQGNDVRGGALQ